MKKLVTLSLLYFSLQGIAQQIPLDTWRSHFSYSSARLLAQADNSLVCVAENGLFLVDLSSQELTVLGKENGLGDVAASAIHFSQFTQKLIIGYESGAIDIIDGSGNITKLNTFRDSPIVGNKRINDIVASGTSAYMATALGILKINLSNNTVIENYRNIGVGGQPIDATEVTIKGDSLYAITVNGVQAGNVTDNLLDFNDWVYFSETSTGEFDELIVANNRLVVLRNETDLWEYNGSEWQPNGVTFPTNIVDLHFNGKLFALSASTIFEVAPLPVSIISDALLISGNEAIVINGAYWIADGQNGLLRVDQTTQILTPAGPINDQPTRIRVVNKSMYALFGPKPNLYNGSSDGLGYSLFSNGQWSTIGIPNFSNITDVSAIGGNRYFSSMGFGIYSENAESILDENNSSMKEGNSFGGVQISGVESYNDELWALSYNAPDALYRINSDQTISTFTPSQVGFGRSQNLTISRDGLIWAIKSTLEGGGIGIYDPIIDQARTLRSNDGLPSSSVTSVAIDTEDEAWIGTNNGIANFSSASYPFNSFGASIPIFQNGFLFENEPINAVMTDGGDRIWVGTNKGVWVLSKNLSEVVHRFTILNSPLPSDQVLSFAYEGNSGEMFILTSKGLVSYRSASSKTEVVHSSKIEVFPNPVRIGTDNVVGMKGLARNANVRITDTSGRLVMELEAVGGTASWNLDSFNNSTVNPGIYLIFSSTPDGMDSLVGKIAILR